jgi:3',5'-cyclic AMP phosphodiesterase CpdA
MTETKLSLQRREALQCLGLVGVGAMFVLNGGGAAAAGKAGSGYASASSEALTFIQISDTHIGFAKPANPDPAETLRETVGLIKALPKQPSFIIHTGDITHLATPEQFDQAQAILAELNLPIHFVPGEHDIVDGQDAGPYIRRFAPNSRGDGWYSFDAGGAHFVALVNVVRLGDKGMGTLGADQLAWLKKDLARIPSSTPVVVFTHFPLWQLYPDWGWGTEDGATAIGMLGKFEAVTVLNGHIHQVQSAKQGRISFSTALSTAFPQPAPGDGPGPGPLFVPPAELHKHIGYRSVARGKHGAATLSDTTLG